MSDDKKSTGESFEDASSGTPGHGSTPLDSTAPVRPLTPVITIQTIDGASTVKSQDVRLDPAHFSDSSVDPEDKTKKTKRTPKKSAAKCDLELRVLGQHSRLKLFSDTEALAATFTTDGDAAELQVRIDILNEEWQQFVATHDYLGLNCTDEFLQSSYVKEGIYDLAYRSYLGARTRLSSLLNAISRPAPQPVPTAQVAPPTQKIITLPPLDIEKFSGDYAKWPEFRDMFTSAMEEHQGLSGVQKLQFLKMHLTGAAAQLIANAPMCDAQFSLSWEAVHQRYENQRLLVGAQLDKLLDLTPMTAKSSEQLNGLINSVSQALNALKAQGISLAPCDGMLLTQLIQKKLDRSTREAWEHSLGSSTDFPKLKKLNEFLIARARALERIGPAQGPNNSAHAQKPLRKPSTSGRPSAYANVAVQSSSSAQRPPVTSGGSSSAQPSTAYPCDMCRGDHYIVKCDKFTALSNADRCQVVLKYQLCSNCLGHHRKEACRSKFRCRVCQGDHHSMIHPGQLSLTTQGSNTSTAQ